MIMATFQSISNFFRRIFGWGGRSSGDERGPRPGDGAVIHHSSGEADFDGLSGDVPPPIKDANRDMPYPPKKSADEAHVLGGSRNIAMGARLPHQTILCSSRCK